MIRHCDGTDRGLLSGHGYPCRCGLSFDDVDRRVIFPHDQIDYPAMTLEELVQEIRAKLVSINDTKAGIAARLAETSPTLQEMRRAFFPDDPEGRSLGEPR